MAKIIAECESLQKCIASEGHEREALQGSDLFFLFPFFPSKKSETGSSLARSTPSGPFCRTPARSFSTNSFSCPLSKVNFKVLIHQNGRAKS